MTTPRRTKTEDTVPEELARQIDENLKRLYGPSSSDELPPDFERLIAALRAGDASPKSGAEGQ